MTNINQDYTPVSCDFQDELELLATQRVTSRIVFTDEAGERQHVDGVVTDIFAKDGADFLTLEDGKTLRLDKIISADATHKI